VALVALTILALVAVTPDATYAQPGTQSPLVAMTGVGSGRVLISSTAEDQGTFAVQITVTLHGAVPQTTFSVSRAVNFQPDGSCTGTTFAPFPGTALVTSPGGAGATHIELHREAPFLSGVVFDVIFRVTGADGSVLESGCMTVTVK
jgi:hypothetical protein